MKVLNLLKKYVVDSQIFVSLTGTLLAVFFMLEQNSFRWPTVFLVFITYFSGYLYTKYQNRRRIFYKILIFNVLSFIVCSVLIILNHNEIRLLKWLIIVILGLLYNSFFLEQFIRKIPLLKVFYVGFVWSLVNAWLFLPTFNLELFSISFLFVTALVLPFDIRDMNEDDVVTFPKIIGVQNTKYLAYVLVFIANIFAIFFLKNEFSVAFTFTSLLTFLLIYFSEQRNSDYYFSFWVESCAGFPLVFLIILKLLLR